MTRPADRRSRSNANERGSAEHRRRRRAWIMQTFRADCDLNPAWQTSDVLYVPLGQGLPLVRCYRCGDLMSEKEMTIDRIIPGAKGGTYRRNDGRSCSYHSRLAAWTFEGTKECLRTHRPLGRRPAGGALC